MAETPGAAWRCSSDLGCNLIGAPTPMFVDPAGNTCGGCLRYRAPGVCALGKHPKPDALTPSCKRWAPKNPDALLAKADREGLKSLHRELWGTPNPGATEESQHGAFMVWAERIIEEVAVEVGMTAERLCFANTMRLSAGDKLPAKQEEWTIIDAARVAIIERMVRARLSVPVRAAALRTTMAVVRDFLRGQSNAPAFARAVAPHLFKMLP